MSLINNEFYRPSYEEDPSMNATEKIVTGFIIGFAFAALIFAALGLFIQLVVG